MHCDVLTISLAPVTEAYGGSNLRLDLMEWYYGAIDRSVAEEILRKCTYNAFLVRDSATIKGSFVASIFNPQLNSMFHCLVTKQIKNGIQSYSFEGIDGGS